MFASAEKLSEQIHENDMAQERVRGEAAGIESQISEQEAAVAVLSTNITHNNENIARVEEELRDQTDRASSLAGQMEAQRARIAELKEKSAGAEQTLAELMARAEELSNEDWIALTKGVTENEDT